MGRWDIRANTADCRLTVYSVLRRRTHEKPRHCAAGKCFRFLNYSRITCARYNTYRGYCWEVKYFCPTYSATFTCERRAPSLYAAPGISRGAFRQTQFCQPRNEGSIGPNKLNRIFSISVEIPAPHSFYSPHIRALCTSAPLSHENGGDINDEQFITIRICVFVFSVDFYFRSKFEGISRAQMFTFSGILVAYCATSSLHLLARTLVAAALPHTIECDSMRLNEANRLQWLGRSFLEILTCNLNIANSRMEKFSMQAGPHIGITNSFTNMEFIGIIKVYPEFSPQPKSMGTNERTRVEYRTECAEQNKNFCHGRMAVGSELNGFDK